MHVCEGDVDNKIVSTALEVAQESHVIVVADDTDIAVMLLYHWNNKLSDIYFFKNVGKNAGA